jgi:serine/threonine-protein kinase RsbW
MMLRMADRLSTAANADNLAEIRRFVREAAAALGADPQTVCSLELAVDEAACNVITHGYRSRAGMIDVEVERDGDAVIIRLRDSAPPFDPTRVPDPDLTLPPQERRLGGMGVYLIRQSVDEMLYRATPEGGNELTLKKRLNKEQDDGYCHL